MSNQDTSASSSSATTDAASGATPSGANGGASGAASSGASGAASSGASGAASSGASGAASGAASGGASGGAVEEPQDISYRVRIQTGNNWNAGTTAQAYVEIKGDKGRTGKIDLSHHGGYKTGELSVFEVVAKDVGDVKNLTIGHSNTGWAPGWFVDDVHVSTKSPRRKVYYFLVNKWLAGSNTEEILRAEDISAPVREVVEGGDYENIYKEVWGYKLWKSRGASEFTTPVEHPSLASRLALAAIVEGYIGFLFVSHVSKGLRGTHSIGVGATGSLTIFDDLKIPPNNFFVPGKRFDCRCRQSNSVEFDDRTGGTRGFAIKFANSKDEAPLDLLLNTGKCAGNWTFPTPFKRFTDFYHPTGDPAHTAHTPTNLKGLIGGWRHNVVSYTHLEFYSQINFHFHDIKGDKYYCKFRAKPADPEQKESGLLSPQQQFDFCFKTLPLDYTKNENYLRVEFKEKVKREGVRYHLEIQLRKAMPGDTGDVYNMAVGWPEDKYPYQKLALIELTKVLDDAEIESSSYLFYRFPTSGVLSLPDTYNGFDDYNSLIWTRLRAYPRLQPLRHAMRTLRGASFTKNDHAPYSIVVKTAKHSPLISSFSGSVRLAIKGTKANVCHVLVNPLKYQHDSLVAYHFGDTACGPPSSITLTLEKPVIKENAPEQESWEIEYISVTLPTSDNMSEIFFPFSEPVQVNNPKTAFVGTVKKDDK